jgi:uncharacterized membrane protein YsdA (DUF1294 family)
MEASTLPFFLVLAAIALVAVNLITFAMFGLDKRLAESGSRRIPERSLLAMAFWGGTPGAYAGRHVFRHKTRKQPFSNDLFTIALLQVVALGGGGTWLLTG